MRRLRLARASRQRREGSFVYLGIDLGTSAVKVALVDKQDETLAEAESSLLVQTPEPGWAEQDPEDWWTATLKAVAQLREQAGASFEDVQAVGLSGQMHGATLLNARGEPLRPAILWNDGRSQEACAELERQAPHSRRLTGNIARPGYTAPKLLWVAEHEPEVFDSISKVLLPKDYLRLMMTGEYATDVSDASGTLWMNTEERAWSGDMLEAAGLSARHVPTVLESIEPTGTLKSTLAGEWGLREGVVVAAGAGDNAAGALAAGVFRSGQSVLSLGAAGACFVSSDHYCANPDAAISTFCHALPGSWYHMSVTLNLANTFNWAKELLSLGNEANLFKEAASAQDDRGRPLFLPYLAGERTPHNNPSATGVLFGLTQHSSRSTVARSIVEGVAFALLDCQKAVEDAGTPISEINLLGQPQHDMFFYKLVASALGQPLNFRKSASPVLGAARLAKMLHEKQNADEACTQAPLVSQVDPDPELALRLQETFSRYQSLYRTLKSEFAVRSK